jgi:hypothetical protein
MKPFVRVLVFAAMALCVIASASVKVSAAEPEVLTVKNCKDLAKLLSSGKQDFDTHKVFVNKYKGRIIEFDGCIAYMMNHGNYKTRYDVLIYRGNYSDSHTTGPSFAFIDINYGNFNLTGSNIPDAIGATDNIHIKAEVKYFVEDGGYIRLDPISTQVR